ncbi:hypothetical protein L7F22_020019 [Adiantum nelumboides]|nr:hypothetical protein [Adiantum nelumboides]
MLCAVLLLVDMGQCHAFAPNAEVDCFSEEEQQGSMLVWAEFSLLKLEIRNEMLGSLPLTVKTCTSLVASPTLRRQRKVGQHSRHLLLQAHAMFRPHHLFQSTDAKVIQKWRQTLEIEKICNLCWKRPIAGQAVSLVGIRCRSATHLVQQGNKVGVAETTLNDDV